MHRAEKASSRICRTREVERAQERHRKKLDGVTSSLTCATRPTAMKPLAHFRRKAPPLSRLGGEDDLHSDPDGDIRLAVSTWSRPSTNSLHEELQAGDVGVETHDRDARGGHNGEAASALQLQHSLAKMDELRSVAPARRMDQTARRHHHHHHQGKIPPSPAGTRKKTLNESVRTRRLKEVRADNVGLLERIKKSVPHYRSGDLKRACEQNMSSLASICELPIVAQPESLLLVETSSPRHQHFQQPRSHAFGGGDFPSSHGTMDARAIEGLANLHERVVVHPIRAMPTSPRKLQLNLCPAFRSLRKGMPQQPVLPPITSPRTVGDSSSSGSCHFGSMCAVPPLQNRRVAGDGGFPGRGMSSFSATVAEDDRDDEQQSMDDREVSGTLLPSRATSVGSRFIGDLGSSSRAQLDVSEKTRYQLLKTGRFVGGTYLVLTVFCGDGITNPYGFDVVAYRRDSKCEYTLHVTKQMTHELLDAVSSSSQAALTAVTAGTNLSMEAIAREICDHINFTTFEGGRGEMVFLLSTEGSTKDKDATALLLLDNPSSTIAFCIHQCVELETTSNSSIPVTESTVTNEPSAVYSNSTGGRSRQTRQLHVFASTRTQTSCPASMARPTSAAAESSPLFGDDRTICFQLCERADPSTCLPTTLDLKVEISMGELCEIVGKRVEDGEKQQKQKTSSQRSARKRSHNAIKDRVSLDRMVVAAVHHLHIVSVPCGGSKGEDAFKDVLIVNQHVNPLLASVSSAAACGKKTTKISIENTRSRHSLRSHDPWGFGLCLLESGVIWKNAYFLARVLLEEDSDEYCGSDIQVPSFASSSSSRSLRRKKSPQYIQDTDGTLSFRVYNPSSTTHSERQFNPDQVDDLVARLESTVALEESGGIQETHVFLKHMLSRLQVEVDLFGREVLTFPSLDVKQPCSSSSATELFSPAHHKGVQRRTGTIRRSPDRQGRGTHPGCFQRSQDDERSTTWAAVAIQAHVRGYLFRKQYYDADEDEEDDGVLCDDDDVRGNEDAGGGSDRDDGEEQERDEGLDVLTEMHFQDPISN